MEKKFKVKEQSAKSVGKETHKSVEGKRIKFEY